MVDKCLLGQARRIVHLLYAALLVVHHIRHVGHGGDDVHIELAVQTLLYNLHVQQSEEAATETKAKGNRRFWRECKRGVIELKLLKRRTQVLVFARVDRIDTGKHHRLYFLESGNGFLARTSHMGDGIAHLYLCGILDARDDVAYLACAQHIAWHHIHLEHAHLVGYVLHAGVVELNLVALAYLAVLYLEVGNDTTEGVEHRVEDKGLQRSLGVARWMGHTLNDGTQHIVHTLARLARRTQDVLALATYQLHNLVFHLVGHSARHIYLVEHRYNLQVVLNGHIQV